MTDPADTGAVGVSVILPFRNAQQTIGRQLEALEAQDYTGAWEVIAVDNRSDDASRTVVERFAHRLRLLLVDAPERLGAGYASNIGVSYAVFDKLLFVDADDEIERGYVSAMVTALESHEFVTSAFDEVSLNPDWVRGAHGQPWRPDGEPLARQFGILPNAGASIGITRHAFDTVGGFPVDLPRMYDIAFSWEVQLAGIPLHHVPEAVYKVRYRDSLLALFRQGLAGSTCAPLLYRRYRSLGMQRRTFGSVARSWARLALDLAGARSRADLAPLMVRLGRELGRLQGSIRYHVLFP